jgi:L-rhamnose-H+ transport protein
MVLALMLVLLAGAMNGSFAVPMKRLRGWQWEHIWLVWSVLAMFIFPLVIALATVPALEAVYHTAGLQTLALTAFYGMIWGGGTVLLGLGIHRIGLALSFGIVLGTSSAIGTVVPLFLLHSSPLFTSESLFLLAGVEIIVAGVVVSARAGLLRERADGIKCLKGSFAGGLAICLLSGIGSSCMSLGLNHAAPVMNAAEALGASHSASVNAVWPILLGGGLVVNAVYCIILIVRRQNGACFRESAGANLALAVGMALLWSGGNFVYGIGAHRMGLLGLVLGWPIYMAMIVLAANAWGFLTGEWRNSSRRSRIWASAGCLLLIGGIWIIASSGNSG